MGVGPGGHSHLLIMFRGSTVCLGLHHGYEGPDLGGVGSMVLPQVCLDSPPLGLPSSMGTLLWCLYVMGLCDGPQVITAMFMKVSGVHGPHNGRRVALTCMPSAIPPSTATWKAAQQAPYPLSPHPLPCTAPPCHAMCPLHSHKGARHFNVKAEVFGLTFNSVGHLCDRGGRGGPKAQEGDGEGHGRVEEGGSVLAVSQRGRYLGLGR